MTHLSTLWRRFSAWGDSQRGRAALAVILAVLLAAAAAPLVAVSSSFTAQRDAVEAALRRANRSERTPEAVELLERGTVTVGDVVHGGPAVLAIAAQVFGDDGTVSSPRELATFIVGPTLPEWAPMPLVSSLWTAVALLLGAVAVGVAAGLTGTGAAGLATLLLTAAIGAIAWQQGVVVWVVAVVGAGGTLLVFLLALRVLLLALSAPTPLVAIAQGVVREAIRLRVVGFFMGATLIIIPLIVVWISPDQPLRYQVQTFLARSMGLLYALVATMTLFLGCATVSFEQRDRQIWQTLTKPVSRLTYLLGKWLGLVGLAAMILAVGSLSVGGFLTYLQTRPAQDIADAAAVSEEILVGRKGMLPEFSTLTREELIESIDRSIESDPILKDDIESGARTELDVRRTLAQQLQASHSAAQRALAPGQSREYRFTGLRPARDAGRVLTLRYKLHSGGEDSHETHPVLIRFPKSGQWTDRHFVANQSYVLAVSPDLIEDDGTLLIELANVAYDGSDFLEPRASFNFDRDGLEILYPVVGFGENYARAMLVDLSKIAFLAMLAVTASSILSFPIACLLAFAVFSIGSLSPFLAISIHYYGVTPGAPLVIQWLQGAIKGIATAVHWLLGGFGSVDVTELLVRGRVVGTDALLRVVGGIGIAWSALALVIGGWAFRRKEIAIYSGQG